MKYKWLFVIILTLQFSCKEEGEVDPDFFNLETAFVDQEGKDLFDNQLGYEIDSVTMQHLETYDVGEKGAGIFRKERVDSLNYIDLDGFYVFEIVYIFGNGDLDTMKVTGRNGKEIFGPDFLELDYYEFYYNGELQVIWDLANNKKIFIPENNREEPITLENQDRVIHYKSEKSMLDKGFK
jgi:hypothetical protein